MAYWRASRLRRGVRTGWGRVLGRVLRRRFAGRFRRTTRRPRPAPTRRRGGRFVPVPVPIPYPDGGNSGQGRRFLRFFDSSSPGAAGSSSSLARTPDSFGRRRVFRRSFGTQTRAPPAPAANAGVGINSEDTGHSLSWRRYRPSVLFKIDRMALRHETLYIEEWKDSLEKRAQVGQQGVMGFTMGTRGDWAQMMTRDTRTDQKDGATAGTGSSTLLEDNVCVLLKHFFTDFTVTNTSNVPVLGRVIVFETLESQDISPDDLWVNDLETSGLEADSGAGPAVDPNTIGSFPHTSMSMRKKFRIRTVGKLQLAPGETLRDRIWGRRNKLYQVQDNLQSVAGSTNPIRYQKGFTIPVMIIFYSPTLGSGETGNELEHVHDNTRCQLTLKWYARASWKVATKVGPPVVRNVTNNITVGPTASNWNVLAQTNYARAAPQIL